MQSDAPDGLSESTAAWWRQINREFVLEPHHLKLLTLAAQALDRVYEAREILARDGLTYTDRFGSPKARPEAAIERDARLAFARLLRELDLDYTAQETARPPALRSNRSGG
jgi:phage terminase small subunit